MRSVLASLAMVALVAGLLAPVAAAAAEGDGTIAYSLDGEVWIATPDGSQSRQVTDGGGPWRNPSISDNGVIVAQRGDAVVRMNSGGTVLSTFEPPQETGGIDHVVVQPNGQNVAYTTTCAGEDCFLDDYARIAYADGRDPALRAEDTSYGPPTWLRDGSGLALLMDFGSAYTFGVSGDGPSYYPNHGESSSPEPLGLEHAAVTPDGGHLAVAGSYEDYDEDFNPFQFARIAFFDLEAATEDGDIVPTACRIDYDPATETPGAISFAPDGGGLVVEVLTPETFLPIRVDIIEDLDPESCAGATSEPFVDLATDPFWSPVDYADLPDDPGAADPELTDPVQLSGTIAYIKDDQVWLSEPDGSASHQLTEGGSWGSPSIAADGTILAAYGEDPDGIHTSLVRLTPSGEVTAFVPEILLQGGILSAEISPDGQYAAYSTAQFCTGSDGRIFTCDHLVIVWADGRTTETLGEAILDSGEAWHPDGSAVITGDGNVVRIGDEDSEPWFSSNTFNYGDPSVSADGSTLALTGTVATTLASMSGPPPAEATEYGDCERAYDAEYSKEIHQAALSPDGRAIVYTLYDEGEDLDQGDIWIAAGIDAADCSITTDYSETMLVSTATDPFWSPLPYEQLADPTGPGGPGGSGSVPPSPEQERTPIDYAIAVSQGRFDAASSVQQAGRAAAHVVLARVDVFADALGGSVLTTDAPLLFTGRDALDPATAAEIDRVLGGSGTVYLLGDVNALAAPVEQALAAAGYTPRRLAGPSRVETAIAVADEAARLHGAPATVAIARADSPPTNPTAAWADSISAGAWAAETGQPILLTQTTLSHPAVAAWLQGHGGAVVFLGGNAAIADQAAAGLVTPVVRAEGTNRYSTAVAIAEQLWPATDSGYAVGNGTAPEAWTYDLAAAGLAADMDQPLLLTEADRLPDETGTALGCPRPAVTIIGTPTLVAPAIQTQITTC